MKKASYKIFHLSSAHSAADVRIFGKEAVTLAAAGHHVTVWGRHPREETRQGVTLRPVPMTASRARRMLVTPWWLFRESLRCKADFYHLHDPELIPVGILLALTGRKVIYDVHEDLPGSIMTKEWIPPLLRWLISGMAALLEKMAIGVLAGFVPATPAIARRFPLERSQLVQNFPRIEEFATHAGSRQPAEHEVIFAYVGALTELRGARQMLDALALTPLHYRLVIMGEIYPPEFRSGLQQHSAWSRVTYLGQRQHPEATQLLMSAHAGLVLFHPAPNHTEAQPNKLFEYMAAGLPVIASDFPLWRELIAGAACGLVVEPLDPAAIAHAMITVAENTEESVAMGTRGRIAVHTRFNWATEGAALVHFYSRLAAQRDPSNI